MQEMKNEVFAITQEEMSRIDRMDNDTLSAFARQKASAILGLFQDLSTAIKDAKQKADAAKDVKTGLFHVGGTRKKATMTVDALTDTNMSVATLATIQQETILFVCSSVRFARAMHETMAAMMVRGFQDSNGNVQTLDENTQQFAQHILNAADDFTRKQGIVEARQDAQDARIVKVEGTVEENLRRLSEKDVLDEVQSERIARNAKHIDDNSKLIALIKETLVKHRHEIAGVKVTRGSSKIAIEFSILSFVISIISLAVALFR